MPIDVKRDTLIKFQYSGQSDKTCVCVYLQQLFIPELYVILVILKIVIHAILV